MVLLNTDEINECFSRWQKNIPDPKPELDSVNHFTFLIAVVLSAQTTDKSVNKATKKLFKIADTPEKMLALGSDKLIEFIKPVGLYKNKAKNIINLCQQLIINFNSEVPDTLIDLINLSGVGRKTANVVLNVLFGEPTMPVDTHILRISPKIGLSEGKNPLQVEKSLLKRIPSKYLKNAHHWILLHGRYTCTAKNPDCKNCIINDLCKHNYI